MTSRRFWLIRQRAMENAGGHTLFFQTESGDRRHPPHFFQPEDVPDFEGDGAWFECEKRGGRWRVVRAVEGG